MSLEKVQQALITALNAALPDWTATRMAWENVAFNPPEAISWLYFHFMPVQETIATLGPTGLDKVNGLAQVTLNFPKASGEKDLRAVVNTLRDAFKPGGLTYDGQQVTILGRSRAGGMSVGNFYAVPFTIRWQAFLTR